MTIDGVNTIKTKLWDCPKFLAKRIEEQEAYIKDISKRYKAGLMSGSRARSITVSAKEMKTIYEKRLTEIYGGDNKALQ